MKTLKTFVSALLIVAFMGSLAGCEKLSNLGNGGHGHSHE